MLYVIQYSSFIVMVTIFLLIFFIWLIVGVKKFFLQIASQISLGFGWENCLYVLLVINTFGMTTVHCQYYVINFNTYQVINILVTVAVWKLTFHSFFLSIRDNIQT